MLITKEVETTWNPNNRKHLESFGYEYVWRGKITIPVEHLTDNSHVKVDVLCDYCLEEGIEKHIPQKWQDYNRSKDGIIEKDCCKKHWYKKCSESNLINYGVDNQFARVEVLDKIKETTLDRYGVEWYTQTEEYKQRHKDTCLEKYGYDNVSKVPEFIEKIKDTQFEKYGGFYSSTDEAKEQYKQTCQDKYGCDNTFQVQEFIDKSVVTTFERYGVTHLMKLEKVRQERFIKMAETKYRNGAMQSSRQQEYIHKIVGGLLNYPLDRSCLDIAFVEDMIFCEYDGSGHSLAVSFGDITQEEFDKKELKRKYFLLSKGWKEIRIISLNDYLPSDDVIIDMLNYSKEYFESGHHWIKFDIDNSKIITSQYIIDVDYGILRKIKQVDLEEVG